MGCDEHVSRLLFTLEQKESLFTLEQKESIETRISVVPVDDSEPISRFRRDLGADAEGGSG